MTSGAFATLNTSGPTAPLESTEYLSIPGVVVVVVVDEVEVEV
jgi:hypothetical protein